MDVRWRMVDVGEHMPARSIAPSFCPSLPFISMISGAIQYGEPTTSTSSLSHTPTPPPSLAALPPLLPFEASPPAATTEAAAALLPLPLLPSLPLPLPLPLLLSVPLSRSATPKSASFTCCVIRMVGRV